MRNAEAGATTAGAGKFPAGGAGGLEVTASGLKACTGPANAAGDGELTDATSTADALTGDTGAEGAVVGDSMVVATVAVFIGDTACDSVGESAADG